MQATIDIDDELLQTAMEMGQVKTEKEAIELALQEYIRMARRQDLASLKGKVQWDGDLDEMRTDPRPNQWDQ